MVTMSQVLRLPGREVDQEQTMANTPDYLVTKFAVTFEAEEREDQVGRLAHPILISLKI